MQQKCRQTEQEHKRKLENVPGEDGGKPVHHVHEASILLILYTPASLIFITRSIKNPFGIAHW